MRHLVMTKQVELIAVGNETGFVLPDDILARLGIGPGDTVYIEEGADGSILLTSGGVTQQED